MDDYLDRIRKRQEIFAYIWLGIYISTIVGGAVGLWWLITAMKQALERM